MAVGLMVPIIVLALVLMATPVVLYLDQHERKIMQRVAMVAERSGKDEDLAVVRSIRREISRHQRLQDLTRQVFCYDQNLTVAYTLPVPLVIVAALLIGICAGALASMALPVLACLLIGLFSAGFAARWAFNWQRDRYANTLLQQIPDMLEFIVSAVRSGIPVVEAFRGVTRESPEPTRSQFVLVMHDIGLGRPTRDALLNLYYRTLITEYAIFAVTIAVQNRSGGYLAETIETLAGTVRERITIAARARALAGEGTVSATILSALPLVTGVALSLIRPGYLDPLFHDPRGRRLFVMSIGALLSGILMMRRMINRAVSE